MDYSKGNIAKDNTSDKLIIKVKVAGENYHDLLIDWSEKSGPNKGQQVVHQLSLITGIPVKNIDRITIANPPHIRYCSILNVERRGLNLDRWKDGFTKENLLGRLNDGDCFAISEDLWHKDSGLFEFSIVLKSRALFNEDECTYEYCHYANNRDFLNRQIAIATNSQLHLKLNAFLVPRKYLPVRRILKELNLQQFVNCAPPYCSQGPSIQVRQQYYIGFASIVMPYYSRTHG
ncbi:uncharacterized protein LOC107366346 [Tetranychus urticae]|uniref:Uncharacterized protein n=1 Tax=Tetranychus urticae TaxID=32264 RepID=T1KR53_TETUR|nr:uncharacterized protein LOC107366346 [Tetranychus urticae]